MQYPFKIGERGFSEKDARFILEHFDLEKWKDGKQLTAKAELLDHLDNLREMVEETSPQQLSDIVVAYDNDSPFDKA